MMDFLYRAMGYVVHFIYFNIWPNYGVTIIILTLLIKGLLLPVAIKQQKAMVGLQRIQPHIEEIRNKYKGDMNKINEETMKLYSEHKVNPLGGCLPTLVQLPVFIALYRVLLQPLTYFLNFSKDNINLLKTSLNITSPNQIEINLIERSREVLEKMQLAQYPENVRALIENAGHVSVNFLYLNLAQAPSISKITPLILIPILAALTTYLSSRLMMKMTPGAKDNQMQQSMMTTMPLVTLFITFSLPAGLGLYWVISNMIQMVQQYFLNKYIPKGEFASNETSGKNG